jgi:hypothetical protein
MTEDLAAALFWTRVQLGVIAFQLFLIISLMNRKGKD